MNTTRHILTQSALVIGAVLVSASIQTFAFTDTSATPPNNDAYAPLTTSDKSEAKHAGLTLNTDGADVGLIVNGAIKVEDSSAETIPCDSTTVGAIRFVGSFQGCDGTSWLPIDQVQPHGSMTWSNPGTYDFTIPEGVSTLKVEVWGAGGAGSGGTTFVPDPQTPYTSRCGAGGGGGGYGYSENYTVKPGDKFTVTVGKGGTAPGYGSTYCITAGAVAAGKGGSSSFGPIVATGGDSGNMGGIYTNYATCRPGVGGTASGPGVVKTDGATGGLQVPNVTGISPDFCRGGSGAPGTGPGAGVGGLGATHKQSTPPGSGTAIGAGGGGGYGGGGTGGNVGSAGAPGQVKITW